MRSHKGALHGPYGCNGLPYHYLVEKGALLAWIVIGHHGVHAGVCHHPTTWLKDSEACQDTTWLVWVPEAGTSTAPNKYWVGDGVTTAGRPYGGVRNVRDELLVIDLEVASALYILPHGLIVRGGWVGVVPAYLPHLLLPHHRAHCILPGLENHS